MKKYDKGRQNNHFNNNKISEAKKYEVTCTGLNELGQGTFNIGKNSYSVSNLLPKEQIVSYLIRRLT